MLENNRGRGSGGKEKRVVYFLFLFLFLYIEWFIFNLMECVEFVPSLLSFSIMFILGIPYLVFMLFVYVMLCSFSLSY